jgi:LAO/AO transport system kinase
MATAEVAALAAGVRSGDRAVLARAITLIESRRADHRADARRLVQELLPGTGKAVRVGITGVPGVGKSTLIDTLGSRITAAGGKVAVLAVDPSSARSGGSILADKTRMARLAADPAAFIRPSPASGTLGGVAARTRETLLLCEAAGYDVVLVETVGIGQSETAVAGMTDVFLVLLLPGAGDEIQGLKKGVIELADVLAVNKAEEANARLAAAAAAEYRAALRILGGGRAGAPVLTCSGRTGEGLDQLWKTVIETRNAMAASGELDRRRQAQNVTWMWAMLDDRVSSMLRSDVGIRERLPRIEKAVAAGELSPSVAADELARMLGIK